MPTTLPNVSPIDIIIGSGISFVVSGLKKIRFVKNHPKAVTAVLSTVVPAAVTVYGQMRGVDVAPVQDILTSIATQYASAIGTHETVTHTLVKRETQP